MRITTAHFFSFASEGHRESTKILGLCLRYDDRNEKEKGYVEKARMYLPFIPSFTWPIMRNLARLLPQIDRLSSPELIDKKSPPFF